MHTIFTMHKVVAQISTKSLGISGMLSPLHCITVHCFWMDRVFRSGKAWWVWPGNGELDAAGRPLVRPGEAYGLHQLERRTRTVVNPPACRECRLVPLPLGECGIHKAGRTEGVRCRANSLCSAPGDGQRESRCGGPENACGTGGRANHIARGPPLRLTFSFAAEVAAVPSAAHIRQWSGSDSDLDSASMVLSA